MSDYEITASRLERLDFCPGSLALERGLPERTTEQAEVGKCIHDLLAAYWNGSPLALVPKADPTDALIQAYIAESQQLIEEYTNGQAWSKVVEERLECVDGFSGKPDLVVMWEHLGNRFAMVLDWKSGWIEQEHSQHNLQLRAYAVLAGLNYHCPTVYVALLQRNAPTVVTRYDAEDLIKAREEIRAIIREATAPGAQRHAGERQCRYCKAIGICPEARATIPEVLAVVDSRVKALPVDAPPEVINLLIEGLTGKQLAYIRERKKIAEMVFTYTDDEIRRRLEENPDSVPGWSLKPGNWVRKITNAQRAFELLDGIVSGSAFASCCTVSIGALEEVVRTTHEVTAAKAKQAVSECLEPVIEDQQNRSSIVRTK